MFDALFSPLGSEYCNFFLYVSIFSFIILVLSVVYVTYSLIYKYPDYDIIDKEFSWDIFRIQK